MPVSSKITSERVICCRCGTAYSKRKGFFAVSYASSYRGVGFLPICKTCIDVMYNTLLEECKDPRLAIRQLCRKLDLYWSDILYDSTIKKNTPRTVCSAYITRLTSTSYAGKSYDETLKDAGIFWEDPSKLVNEKFMSDVKLDNFLKKRFKNTITVKDLEKLDEGIPLWDTTAETPDVENEEPETEEIEEEVVEEEPVSEEVILFWGSGYTPNMYRELQQRYQYWINKLSGGSEEDIELDIGTEAIIRQICSLELDINRDRAAGRSVDKNISALNTLLGSANLKPAQRKKESGALNDIPFGVGIGWCEKHKPIAEASEEFKDVDGIRKYVSVWLYGHLAKMLGKKNLYTRLYEEEIAKLRVERPQFVDEDDEAFVDSVLSSLDDE